MSQDCIETVSKSYPTNLSGARKCGVRGLDRLGLRRPGAAFPDPEKKGGARPPQSKVAPTISGAERI